MPSFVLYDPYDIRTHLLPLTFTRPVAEIRCGIWTLTEKWEHYLSTKISFLTEPYLQAKYQLIATYDNVFVNGAVCASEPLAQAVLRLQMGEVLVHQNTVIAYRSDCESAHPLSELKQVIYNEPCTIIRQLWDIYAENGAQIKADFGAITKNKTSQPLTDPHTVCYSAENIFLEEGATIRAAILNADNGPIYIGKNATIAEGSIVMGPFALGEGSTVNWGGKMRMNTTIGPHCKAGGEISNSVLMGYSNKAHDGFLGNAVIGEWCNLGANTNNSNLKNDYTNVKIYNYKTRSFEDSGKLFCGLFMGDYTKVGINTMFNTGTVVGVSSNVFGSGFQPKHIDSFRWGGAGEGIVAYRVEKAIEVIRQTVARRGKIFDAIDEEIIRSLVTE